MDESLTSTPTQPTDYPKIIIASIVSIGFVALLAVLCFAQISPTTLPILMTMLGVLAAAVQQIVSFFFGSSQSSANKDILLYHSAPTQTQQIEKKQ